MKKIYTLLASMALLMAVGMVKVNAQVVDVCAGNDTVELRLGNFQYGYVQWQVSDDIETWFDIDGAIDTVYRFLPERPRYYRAEVHFPACMENDYYSQVSYVQIPPKAFAGPDMSIPAGTVARLCASSFKGAEGEWHIIEGTNGLIENASNPKSGFIGEEGEYKLTWTVINSCGSNTDTVTVRCVRMEYQPNIVYVDETDAILSDSTQLVNGEYVIVFSDPAPDIQVGSVLLGYRVPSFLRKVVSFEREGDLYVMQTEQGVLTDILLSGALFFDPIGDIEGGGRSSVKYIDRYPTRKEMLDNPFMLRDGSTYLVRGLIPDTAQKGEDWEATVTVEDGVLTLVLMMNLGLFNDDLDGLIYRGTVSLEPNMRSNIFPEEGQLTECYLGCYDAVFSHTESLSIDKALSAVDVGGHGSINPSPIIFPFAIGGVPIVVSMDFPVSFKVSAALDGLNLSFTSSTTFTSAIEYDPETHEFNKIFEKQEPMETPGEFDLTGTLGMNFQAGMKFSILIAGVVGPYAEWRATVNPSICVSSLPPYHANADLKVGLDMDLGVRFHLFKDLLESDVCFNFPLYERVEHAPNSVNKYLGDNQVYSFGNYLTTPITVDVEGWFGSKLPLAKIYFEPEIGGEVTDPVASTDIHGKASTRWRPNSPTGRDKLRVKAFDCHGNLIGGTPVVFHAYSSATDPCINSDLTVEVYHVQEDRIIPLVRGESPFLYSTDGESFSSTIPNIQTHPGHNYTFYVQDKNGCEAMTTYNEPFYDCDNSSLMLSVTTSGDVITATGHFGFDPYWYSIDGINYQPTGLFGVQLDGEYTVFVRDALGCVDTKHVTVSREGNLYVWISEINGHSGTAEVMASSGSLAERGVCWSTHHAPTVEDLHASFGPGTGVFPFTINGLDPETTYYVRAYALDLSGTSYSEERCINPSNGVYLPEVAATGITSITQTAVVGSGNVIWDGGAEVTERGICWGTSHYPDISGDHIPCGSGIGAYTADITDLTPNMQYYARAYATNSEGTAYGDEVEFTTIGNGGGGGGVTHEYVDLGLPSGTLWATCNIGASMPVEFGDRFAWGETQPKDVYNWDTYQFCIDHKLTKYCSYSQWGYNGFSDTLTVLLPEDDVATVLWGGNWRMPTKAQWIELFRNTAHTFTTQNGVEGELFIASNGNSLFLPYISSGTYSRYWSSSLDTNSPYDAWQLYFNSHGWQMGDFTSTRCKGTPIRPVRSTHYIGDLPYVTTSEVTEYTSTTAICGGNVVFDGGVMVTERGVCWSTIHNPTLNDSNSSAGAGLGDFAVNITGLAPLTTYYVRAFATNVVGTVYGNEMSFTTLFGGGGIYEYVDLGLPSGTLWATCNVGSNSPEGYGVCFAWGETTPKTTYNWNTYQYCNNGDSHQLTKYCNNSVYGYNGFTDNLTTLLLEDDAATVNWGNGWRTPTKEEWDELWNNTTSIWATQNGMNGRLFTASNGNSIFVRSGDYWSSSIYYDYSNFAYLLGFWEHGSQWDGLPRCKGYPIRPVYSGSFPHVITSEVSVFTSSTATFGGNVVSDEGSEVTERGVCWSTTHNPTIGGNHASAGGGLGDFAVNVTGLASATTYYVRAYATNSAGTAYGNEVSFTTFSGGGGIHEYVDLGLPSGTLWATCNVGANTPEEYGDYFAWGETQPKDYYDWSTYQYCNGDYNQMTKYCNNSMYGYNGFTDDLTTLLPEDDAATVNWGNEWRMPTSEEFEELYQNTTSTWITQNGVKGMRFTSSNGNSLFLPAGGWQTEDSFNSAGDQGKFWSLDLDNGFVAWNFEIFWSGYSLFDDVRSNGLSIRPVRSTSPSAQLPEVIFGPIVTVGTDANIIGVVVSDGGTEVTDRGVCWSTSPNPNISGNHISAGAGVGDFSVTIQGLEFGTTYYVRAYATNSVGTAYSNEESFTPTPGGGPVTPEPPEGAIDGLFSVASDYQVFFSQGNLQYQASTNTWRFAENQWDYEGEDNNNISPTYDGWIDLFGWGTSGYNHGAVCYQPWSTSLGASDYLAYGNADYNLFDQTGQADWGYNAISNGGDTENQWRTLTESEWDYVLNMRNTTSGIRYALATVNGVKGLILISDLWQDSNYSLSNPNTMDTTFDNNVIDAVTWEYQFEGAGGCVFLPAAGERYGIGVAYVGTFGLYWSSNNKPEWGDYYASYFDFAQWGEPYPGVWSSNREYGFAVRLVQDAPNGSGSGNGGGGRK